MILGLSDCMPSSALIGKVADQFATLGGARFETALVALSEKVAMTEPESTEAEDAVETEEADASALISQADLLEHSPEVSRTVDAVPPQSCSACAEQTWDPPPETLTLSDDEIVPQRIALNVQASSDAILVHSAVVTPRSATLPDKALSEGGADLAEIASHDLTAIPTDRLALRLDLVSAQVGPAVPSAAVDLHLSAVERTPRADSRELAPLEAPGSAAQLRDDEASFATFAELVGESDVEKQDPGVAIKAEVTWHASRDIRVDSQSDPWVKARTVSPHEVARQVAHGLSASDQNRIEITLTPEELGKIRLVITPGDSPTISVHADNRETLDLLRRNAELLHRELRDTGFGGAALSFGDENRGKSPASYAQAAFDDASEPAPDAHAVTDSGKSSDRRLDIRI